jgi:hypothetical protein
MTDNTRYQIMGRGKDEKRPIENFTAREAKKYTARKKELQEQGVEFTVWDTRNNSLSRTMFGGL